MKLFYRSFSYVYKNLVLHTSLMAICISSRGSQVVQRCPHWCHELFNNVWKVPKGKTNMSILEDGSLLLAHCEVGRD